MNNGVKRNGLNPRKGKYMKMIIEFIAMHDRPVSFHEILDHSQTWRHGLVSNELGNMLSKSNFFVRTGSVKYKNGRSYSGPYDISLWVLADHIEVPKVGHKRNCLDCDTYMKNQQKSRCGICYLKWKKAERAKNGEA